MKRSLISVASVMALCAVAAVSIAGEKAAKSVASVGQAAPLFALQDQDGKTVNLADLSDKVVVLEWFNNECPYVVKHYRGGHMNTLAKKYTDKGVVWLAVNTTKGKTNADNKAIAGEWKIDRPILNDALGETGRAYGARTTPHMYVINKGTLVYAGAIDSDSSPDTAAIDGATNYVAKALDEVLAGSNVTKAETKSYGCSVKYAK